MKRRCVLVFALGILGVLGHKPAWPASPECEALIYFRSSVILESPTNTEKLPVERVIRGGTHLGIQLALKGARGARRVLTHGSQNELRSTEIAPEPLDPSRFLCIEFPSRQHRDEFLNACADDEDILIAEPNQRAHVRGEPNDTRFNEQWNLRNVGQSSGTPGADIRATRAWDFVVGNAAEGVAIIDLVSDPVNENISQTNPDLSGRVLGAPGTGVHPTMVAGVVAAKGNNGVGVAGLNWNTVVKSYVSDGSLANVLNSINAAINDGFKIINYSVGIRRLAMEGGKGSRSRARSIGKCSNRVTLGEPPTGRA